MKADWIGLAEAIRRVVDSVQTVEGESCPVREADDRILAEDVVAPVDIPRWTNSAMDGFAVRSTDVEGAAEDTPVTLRVVDDIPAGSFPNRGVGRGEAARVMTGAPVPDGADGVIRVEHTDGGSGIGSDEAHVQIRSASDAGKNLRRKGEDLSKGSVALSASQRLTPAALGVAASLGYAKLRVVRKPLVALLTSGDELVEVEQFEEVREGRRIVSSNSYTLAAQLREAGCLVRYLGIASDTPESLWKALQDANGCDALVTSAGISVGEHDHIKGVLAELGAEVDFWRVRIRPGSPFAFGRIGGLGGIPWFGLPGNPVSSMVTFEVFARPALLRMGGHPRVFRRTVQAVLEEAFSCPAGLTQLVRVRLREGATGAWSASLTGAQGSGILSSLAKADGLMIIPEDQAGAEAGETVKVLPFAEIWSSDEPPV